jgi:hypothetical protein
MKSITFYINKRALKENFVITRIFLTPIITKDFSLYNNIFTNLNKGMVFYYKYLL